jgi:hypothetical protein
MSQQPPDRPTEPPEGWRPPGGQQPPPEGAPGGAQGQGWGQTPGQQGPYGPPPGQQPGWGPSGPATATQPPQKRSKGRTFAIGCLSIVALFVVVGIATALFGGGSDDGGSGTAAPDQPSATTTRTRNTTKTTAAPAPEVAGIGDAVRDGKFEFVVSKVACGRNRIGDTNFGKDAQGQFCTVNVKVKNIGKEAQTLDASSQYLYGSGGQRFDADTEAAVYLGLNETRTFLEDINPGNSVNGVLIYDIPKGQKPTKIELHDSPFSGGVTVEL